MKELSIYSSERESSLPSYPETIINILHGISNSQSLVSSLSEIMIISPGMDLYGEENMYQDIISLFRKKYVHFPNIKI